MAEVETEEGLRSSVNQKNESEALKRKREPIKTFLNPSAKIRKNLSHMNFQEKLTEVVKKFPFNFNDVKQFFPPNVQSIFKRRF